MDKVKRMEHDIESPKTHYDAQTKLKIIYIVEKGLPIDDAVKAFGASRRSIYDWKRQYKERGLEGLENAPHPGRPPQLAESKIKRCMDKIIQRNEIMTVKRLQRQIHHTYHIKYSMSGIRKILAKNGHTFKKAVPVHVRAATNDEADRWRKTNIPKIREFCAKGFTLVSEDEATIEIDPNSRYGYSKSGTRIYVTYNGTKQKLGMFGIIAENGKTSFRITLTFNSDTFLEFIIEARRIIGPMVMVVDNASWHKSKKVKQWLAENPDVVLIYLPVGSPHMNLIEIKWGIVKAEMSNTVYLDKVEFKAQLMKLLRRKNIRPDVYKKLFKRLEPSAEACVIDARKKHPLLVAR